jgi:hypothetical protein
MHKNTHTHTHTHINIYIYIYTQTLHYKDGKRRWCFVKFNLYLSTRKVVLKLHRLHSTGVLQESFCLSWDLSVVYAWIQNASAASRKIVLTVSPISMI